MRKSQFSTLTDVNAGFGSPWDKLGIYFVNVIVENIQLLYLHNASKEVFWPKTILNSMHGFKSAILAIFHFWQNGTFELVHEIQIFFRLKDFF